jgi:hypothetical protein
MRFLWFSNQPHLTPQSPASPVHLDVQRVVDRSLRQILLVCEEACAARQAAPKDSPEWYKRTGEILAYGKLTSILCELQASVPPHERH